jgi:hypothetical protein
MINIERAIEMQPRPLIKETLIKMNVGDSIVVAQGKDSAWRIAAKKLGYKVQCQTIQGTNTYRMWKVA